MLVDEEVGELVDRCRKAALADLSLPSNDELRAVALRVEAARAALDALQGHALAELEARDACDTDLGLSTVGWLIWHGRVPRRQAAARVRVANKLRRDLDGVDGALADGRITFEHARVLADAANPRIVHQIATVQDRLVAAADRSPFEIWRREVAGLAGLVDEDGGHDPAQDLGRNRLHVDRVGDATVLRGELVGEPALIVSQALESATDSLWRRFRDDHDRCAEVGVPARSVLGALALSELCRTGLTTANPAPVVDVTVVIDASDGRVRTPDGDPVDARAVAHLWCDPVLHALVRDQPSVPLDLKRSARLASPGQRRALAVRDGGCVFPGCGAPVSWCEIHHVTPWDDGGSTDLHNLAPLCRHHHGVTHRDGWTMQPDPDRPGRFTWATPAGRILHSQRHRAPP